MGIAKTINAIGVYDFFTFDHQLFAETISNYFDINIELCFSFHIEEFDEVEEKEIEYLNFGKKDTWRLTVNYFKIDEAKSMKNNLTCSYDIYIPMNIKYETRLLLEFNDRGFFQLNYIPFNSTWNFFIEDITGLNDYYFKTKLDFYNSINEVRNGYMNILQKINSSKVILTTDADYNFECEIYNPNSSLSTFDELIHFMKEKDSISFHNFIEVVNKHTQIESKRNSFLDIALIDDFSETINVNI